MAPGDSDVPRLVGWKDVAAYLGKSVRTVQRWEKELGLPVRHVRTSATGQTIYAGQRELDEWLLTRAASSADDGDDGRDGAQGLAGASEIDPEEIRIEEASSAEPTHPLQMRQRRTTWTWRAIAAALLLAVTALLHQASISVPASPGNATANGWLGSSRMYIGVSFGVLVLDGATGKAERLVSLPQDAEYGYLGPGELSPDERTLVFPTGDGEGVALFDLASEGFVRWYPMPGRRVKRSRFRPDMRELLVVDQDGRLYGLDAATGEVVGAASLPGECFDAIPDRQGRGVYVANRDAGTLSHVDLTTFESGPTIRTGAGAHDIVTSPDGSRGFVTNEYDDSVSCVDLDERRVIGTTPVGDGPNRLAISPDGGTVYVANRDGRSLSIVDAVACETLATIADVVPGSRPLAVGVSGNGRQVYVSGLDAFRLAVYDVTTSPPTLVSALDLPGLAETIHAAPRSLAPALASAGRSGPGGRSDLGSEDLR